MAFGKLIAALKTAEQGLASLAASVETHAATIGPKIDQLTDKADQLHHRTKWLEEDKDAAEKTLDVFDRLLAKSQETQNDFSKDFELDMQRVRLGVITLNEYITKWGDAQIATGDGFETIREAFAGADFGQYRQEIQQLISDIKSGGAQIGEIVTFLKENAGDLAKGLINVLELFKAGKASLEDVQRVLDATKKAFPGAESDALAEAIRNALLSGEL